MKKIITTIFSYFLIFFFLCTQAHAQQTDASFILSPQNPEPKSTVQITLTSQSFNTGIAFITWQVEGKNFLQGRGEDVLTLKTGDTGTVSHISVRAELIDGTFVTKNITLSPSSVTLLYEAPKSYVPVTYEGRSLPSSGATVRVTAIPQMSDGGVMLDPSSLSYSWYINDQILKNSSGYGRQSANIDLDYLQESNDIKVVVYSPNGTIISKTITITPHEVMPLLYTYTQLFGTDLNSLVEKRFEATNDFTLSLEPFYISDKETKSPTYTWFLDGLPSTPFGGRLLALHPKENSYGSKTLTIKVEGPTKVLQTADLSTELIFDTRK